LDFFFLNNRLNSNVVRKKNNVLNKPEINDGVQCMPITVTATILKRR